MNDIARFLNNIINSYEVFVIRMSDTHDTNVDRLVRYLRAAFPGDGTKTGINDHYSRTRSGQPWRKQSSRTNVYLSLHKIVCVMPTVGESTLSSYLLVLSYFSFVFKYLVRLSNIYKESKYFLGIMSQCITLTVFYTKKLFLLTEKFRPK